MDDHIKLLYWRDNEAVLLEFKEELWYPRIELQGLYIVAFQLVNCRIRWFRVCLVRNFCLFGFFLAFTKWACQEKDIKRMKM